MAGTGMAVCVAVGAGGGVKEGVMPGYVMICVAVGSAAGDTPVWVVHEFNRRAEINRRIQRLVNMASPMVERYLTHI